MRKLLSAVLLAVFATASFAAIACPGDKAKDGKGEMSVPEKPKT